MKLDAIIAASEKEPAAEPAHAGTKAAVEQFLRNAVVGAVDGVSAGIAQERDERSAERNKEEVRKKILVLEVAKELQVKFLPRLETLGYRLEPRPAEHPYGGPDYRYTALRRNGAEVALLQVPRDVFTTDDSGNELHDGDFTRMLIAFRGKTTRLFAHGIDGLTYTFDAALVDQSRGADWIFIPWSDVIKLQEEKLKIWQALKLPKPSAVPDGVAAKPKGISTDQVNQVVGVLARAASHGKLSSAEYFRGLVNSSPWPKEWKSEQLCGWKDLAPTDARTFVDFMMDMKVFPGGHDELAGLSVVGEFLRYLLKENKVGGDDMSVLAHIVVECALVPDAGAFKKYYLS